MEDSHYIFCQLLILILSVDIYRQQVVTDLELWHNLEIHIFYLITRFKYKKGISEDLLRGEPPYEPLLEITAEQSLWEKYIYRLKKLTRKIIKKKCRSEPTEHIESFMENYFLDIEYE